MVFERPLLEAHDHEVLDARQRVYIHHLERDECDLYMLCSATAGSSQTYRRCCCDASKSCC
jgi:hypothetical protein